MLAHVLPHSHIKILSITDVLVVTIAVTQPQGVMLMLLIASPVHRVTPEPMPLVVSVLIHAQLALSIILQLEYVSAQVVVPHVQVYLLTVYLVNPLYSYTMATVYLRVLHKLISQQGSKPA